MTAPSLAGRREWIGLATLALPTLLISMDATVLYLAVPAISADLHPNNTQLLWITDIFGFMMAGLLITMGTLGDRFGKRRLLLIGAIAFTGASATAAFSRSVPMLIASRGLLGVAGAALLPTTVALIREMFHDERQRTFALGCWTTCFSTGTMLGPVVGGVLLGHFWWGSVFLMGVPVMLLFLVLGPVYLPEYRHHTEEGIDLLSVLLFLLAALSVTYGIKQWASDGASPVIALPGLGVGWLFVWRQQRLVHPLIDPSLFRFPAFNVTLLALFLVLFNWAGLSYFEGQYLQLVLGFSPAHAGVWTVPAALGSVVGCLAAPQAVRRLPRYVVVGIGMTGNALGALCLTHLPVTGGLPLFLVGTILLSMGTGITVTLGVDLVLTMTPPGRTGAAAGVYETSTNLGSSLGVALLGSIGVAVYHLPDTLGGTPAGALREQAQRAFVAAFHAASLVAGLAMLAVMILTVLVLRRLNFCPKGLPNS